MSNLIKYALIFLAGCVSVALGLVAWGYLKGRKDSKAVAPKPAA